MQGLFESHQRFPFRATKRDVRLTGGIQADLQQCAGNKGIPAQGILPLDKRRAAFPGEGLCLLYKTLLSNQVLVQKVE